MRDIDAVWSVSAFCAGGDCVEIGRLADGSVAVRDTKNREGGALVFTADEWSAFVAGAKAGQFD